MKKNAQLQKENIKRPGRGRPRSEFKASHPHCLPARFTAEQYRAIRILAAQDGIFAQEWLHRAAMREIARRSREGSGRLLQTV
jgi:hypothetical protein